jgi:drug/metabolite transporter (DMT)-like permease
MTVEKREPSQLSQVPQPPEATRPRSSVWTLQAAIGFGLMTLIWGSFSIAVKVGVNGVPPFLLAGIRFCLAGALLFALLLIRRERLLLPRQRLPGIVLLALLIIGIPSACFFWASQYAPAGTLSTIWATSPIFTALVSIHARNEVRGWRVVLSLAVGLVGVALVFIDKLDVGDGQALAAEGAVLCAAAFFGIAMRIAKNTADLPLLPLTAWELLLGGIILSIASLLFEYGQPVQWTAVNVSILLYLAIFASCVTYWLTFWLIQRIGAIRTSYNSFLVPGIALVLANLLLGEPITLPKLAGMALVVGGLALVVRG